MITSVSREIHVRVMLSVSYFLLCFLAIVHPSQSAENVRLNYNGGNDLKMVDLVMPLGYPLKRHLVQTDDGYTLGVYRVPHGRQKPQYLTKRPVVYLQHGLLDSSAAFAMNGRNGSLAFVLADAGFDVWLGNSRGNTFSNHDMQSAMPHDTFWDFSMDELIFHDLPATLQYIVQKTKVRKMIYIGHSQGTATAHALFATHHPITKHVALAVMLAPVAFVRHITSPVMKSLALLDTAKLVSILGFHQFLPSQKIMETIGGNFCKKASSACESAMAAIMGYNPKNIDPNRWGTFLKYTPAGTSVKVMAHWGQGVRNFVSPRFQAYDYGTTCWNWRTWHAERCNQRIYGDRVPREYEIDKIQIPLVFIRGGHDALADIHDVEDMKRRLRPGVLLEDHLILDYTHLDYIWGKNAPERVCKKLLLTLKRLFGPDMNPEQPIHASSVV